MQGFLGMGARGIEEIRMLRVLERRDESRGGRHECPRHIVLR